MKNANIYLRIDNFKWNGISIQDDSLDKTVEYTNNNIASFRGKSRKIFENFNNTVTVN